MKNLLNILITLLLVPALAFALDDKSKNIKALTKQIDAHAKLAQLYFQRAESYMQMRAYKEASLDVNKAIVLAPQMQEAKLLLAKLNLSQKKNTEAIENLTLFVKSTKDKSLVTEAKFLLADAYVASERYEDAATQYEKMKAAKVEFEQEHYAGFADVYYRLGNYKKSIKVLKDALSTMIEKDLLRRKIIDLSIEEGNYTLAMSMTEQMLKRDKNNSELYYIRASILQHQGKTKEMESTIKKAQTSLKNETKMTQEKKSLTRKSKSLYASI